MISTWTRSLLIAATVLSGLLAGGNVDRAIVAMPAWEQAGTQAWADFSRHADLGNGLVLYPLEAIGAVVLIVAAAASLSFDRMIRGPLMLPLGGAVVLAAAGLLCTLRAAPIMLSVGHLGDPAAIRRQSGRLLTGSGFGATSGASSRCWHFLRPLGRSSARLGLIDVVRVVGRLIPSGRRQACRIRR